jgi:hypothetical protein
MLVSLGLLSSTFHLGHPERAWRAFSQWRSSWLSREGVAAVATYLPAGLLFLALVLPGGLPGPASFAALLALGAVLTVWCTGMIYASLRTVPEWNHGLVPVIYLVLALGNGGGLAGNRGRRGLRDPSGHWPSAQYRACLGAVSEVGLLAQDRRRARALHHCAGPRYPGRGGDPAPRPAAHATQFRHARNGLRRGAEACGAPAALGHGASLRRTARCNPDRAPRARWRRTYPDTSPCCRRRRACGSNAGFSSPRRGMCRCSTTAPRSEGRRPRRNDGAAARCETHDPARRSWVESANASGCDFPIQNLPIRRVPERAEATAASAWPSVT